MSTTVSNQTVSLAVLPFSSVSEQGEQNHLISGFIDDLIVDLSRYSGLDIIASYTANLLGTGDIDLFEAAEEISIAYLLKGSIRFTRETIRINTQLVHVGNRKIVWAERYDTTMASFF